MVIAFSAAAFAPRAFRQYMVVYWGHSLGVRREAGIRGDQPGRGLGRDVYPEDLGIGEWKQLAEPAA